MARFIECMSEDETEFYLVNVDAIALLKLKRGLSPENTIVFIGGEKVKAQIVGDKANEFREAMGLKEW